MVKKIARTQIRPGEVEIKSRGGREWLWNLRRSYLKARIGFAVV